MSSTCVDVEEVGKKTPRDRLMTDHNHVLLTLKFHDDWLQSTHDIHVRLHTTPAQHLVTIGSPVSSSHLSRRHTCLIITLVSSSCLIVTPVSSSHLSHHRTCLIVTPFLLYVSHHSSLIMTVSTYHVRFCLNLKLFKVSSLPLLLSHQLIWQNSTFCPVAMQLIIHFHNIWQCLPAEMLLLGIVPTP